MFIITNNNEIKISTGEQTANFPLILNTGSTLEPSYYTFVPSIYLGGQTSTKFDVFLNSEVFNKKCKDSGLYSFYHLDDLWYLFDDLVDLTDYGLSCKGILENEDAFSVIKDTLKEDSVEFYIIPVNAQFKDWLVKKTFYKSGVIISEYLNRVPTREVLVDILDLYRNILLHLDSKDTDWLDSGLYEYLVWTSLVDKKTNKALRSAVTGRLPFYVLDDNIDRRLD